MYFLFHTLVFYGSHAMEDSKILKFEYLKNEKSF